MNKVFLVDSPGMSAFTQAIAAAEVDGHHILFFEEKPPEFDAVSLRSITVEKQISNVFAATISKELRPRRSGTGKPVSGWPHSYPPPRRKK